MTSSSSATARRSARQHAPGPQANVDNTTNASPIQSTDEQLERAMATVLKTRDRTIQLHRSWRSYLQRTSILVMFLALHQLRSTAQALSSLKKTQDEHEGDGGYVWLWILNNSLCEVTGVAVTGFLRRFLSTWVPQHNVVADDAAARSARNNFTTDLNFMIASGLLPAQWILYHHYKNKDGVSRSFPVSVVFFLIVVAAYGFMNHTMKQCDEHVDLVKRMKHQVAEARSVNQRMKTTAAKAAAKHAPQEPPPKSE